MFLLELSEFIVPRI